MCACVCMCAHVYMCICVHVYLCTCVHVYVYMCRCVGVYVCICMCVYVCLCVCVHVYVYVYVAADVDVGRRVGGWVGRYVFMNLCMYALYAMLCCVLIFALYTNYCTTTMVSTLSPKP